MSRFIRTLLSFECEEGERACGMWRFELANGDDGATVGCDDWDEGGVGDAGRTAAVVGGVVDARLFVEVGVDVVSGAEERVVCVRLWMSVVGGSFDFFSGGADDDIEGDAV